MLTNCRKYPKEEWITIQGETYGKDIQKRDYSRDYHDFVAFNLIYSTRGRVGTEEMYDELTMYNVPCVPQIEKNIDFTEKFATVEDMLLYAEGNSKIDHCLPREGIVFRTMDGQKSFKAVSNSFLLKYHG